MKLKIAYFGSPSFSATFLEKIINDKELPVEVKLVVTQPDMPVGRKQVLTPTPVKKTAQKHNIKVINQSTESATGGAKRGAPSSAQYQRALDGAVERQNLLRDLKKIDLCLVYAYGEILPKELLNLPKYGFWNIHPSLLPKYCGASPIAYPLIMGDKTTGVSLILMDEKVDHGPIIAQEKLKINPDDMRLDLEKKLTDLVYDIFKKQIITVQKKAQTPSSFINTFPQNHSQTTYTSILKKSDGFIPLSILKKAINNEPLKFTDLPEFFQKYTNKYHLPPNSYLLTPNYYIYNLFRGLSPWPGLWTLVKIGNVEKRLKITDVKIIDNQLQIKHVQLEGKNPVNFKTFNTAYKLLP